MKGDDIARFAAGAPADPQPVVAAGMTRTEFA